MSEEEKAPKVKRASVTKEEVRTAALDARTKLVNMQKEITTLLTGLDGILKDGGDANFTTRDAIKALLEDVEGTNPKEVLKALSKVHNARLLARAKEGV